MTTTVEDCGTLGAYTLADGNTKPSDGTRLTSTLSSTYLHDGKKLAVMGSCLVSTDEERRGGCVDLFLYALFRVRFYSMEKMLLIDARTFMICS